MPVMTNVSSQEMATTGTSLPPAQRRTAEREVGARAGHESNGRPMSYAEGGKSFPVYYIKIKNSNYIVAGDSANDRIYHQPHNGRPNAQWTLEPVIGPEGTQWHRIIAKLHDIYHRDEPPDSYPCYT